MNRLFRRRSRSGRTAAIITGLTALLSASPSWADPPLVSVGAGAAGPLTNPQRDWFTWGPQANLAVLGDPSPYVQLGGRVRAMRLFDSEAPPARFDDPEGGGLYTLSALVRLRPFAGTTERRGSGLFLDGAVGPGLTGDLVRFAFEGGLGYLFPVGKVNVGPTAHYQHVLQGNGAAEPSDGRFLHLGIELQFFDSDPEPRPVKDFVSPLEPEPKPEQEPTPKIEPKTCKEGPEDYDGFEDTDNCLDADNDGDGILDVVDKCPNEPETVNGVNDLDGCPDTGAIELVDERVTIDSELFFEFDRAVVKEGGWDKLKEVKALWESHPEWAALEVVGHADKRGPKDYNQDLSERRAEAVKKVLVALGMAEEKVQTRGDGEPPPSEAGDDAEAYQENRRVDFLVVRKATSSTAGPDDPATEQDEMQENDQ